MYKCVKLVCFYLYVPAMVKQRERTWQEQAFSLWTVPFDMTEGSFYISLRLEMKECMRCDGFLLVLANTWWLGGSQRVRSLHWTRPSDILGEETELFSVLVQGGGCTPLFSYSLHMREWTLKLNWPDVPSLFHPSFTHPTSSLCSPGSHSVPLSWGNIFSCWDGGKGTRYRDKLAFYKFHQSSYWTRYVSWFSFCFLYIIFVCVCVISLAVVE